MAIDYLDEDYTITLYSYNKNQHKTLVAEYKTDDTVTENVVTQSILNNYTWRNTPTGSTYETWPIVSGTSAIGAMNPNNTDDSMSYSDIGARLEIRGTEIYSSVFRESSSEENNGVAIYDSASSGWYLKDYINAPTSSMTGGVATNVAREFSLDNDHLAISATDLSYDDSRLFIYKSSSTGWDLTQTLTTASYNDGAAANVTAGRFSYLNSRIKGNVLIANGFRTNSDRFVAFFKSSSSGGWAFEKEVQVADSSDSGGSDYAGAVGVSGVCLDFDGTTAVVGAKHGDGPEAYHAAAGRVKVITSSSAGGWTKTADLGLLGLGLTSNVSSTYGTNYTSEYRTYDRFGYKACSVSGSYIAAAAQGQNIGLAGGAGYRRQKHSVFIMKSGSTGYILESRLDDPADNLVLSGSSSGDTTDSRFGEGIILRENVLVVASPTWESEWGTTPREGRYYIYVSTSAGGWSLDQTINNPYSGSVFQANGSAGDNMQMGLFAAGGYSNAGDFGYGVRPAVSGNILALGAPYNEDIQDPNGSTTISSDPLVKASSIYGAFYPLSGSENYYQQEITEYTTESVTTKWVSSSNVGNPPFRLNTNTIQNIREQSPTNSYKTFIGEQKT